jgi:hypothetical protein
MRMTNEERQLLKDTAENLLRLLNRWDDTIGGMTIAISELYRAASTSPSRKIALLGRLRLHRDLMAREGKGVKYLSDLIENWINGLDISSRTAVMSSAAPATLRPDGSARRQIVRRSDGCRCC